MNSQKNISLEEAIQNFKKEVSSALKTHKNIHGVPCWQIKKGKTRDTLNYEIYVEVSATLTSLSSVPYVNKDTEKRLKAEGDYTHIHFSRALPFISSDYTERVHLYVDNICSEVYHNTGRNPRNNTEWLKKLSMENAKNILNALMTKDLSVIESAYINSGLIDNGSVW